MIVGVDPGGRRVGVALGDARTGWARPLEVIDSKIVDPVARIVALAHEHNAERIVVGRPVSLSGAQGPAVEAQQAFLARLRSEIKIPVEEYDERLTTVIAEQRLRTSGAPATRRREMRDAVAAQVMLQGYLDSRR